MICSYCAAEMPEVSAFCPDCGRSVAAAAEIRAYDLTEALMGAAAYLAVLPAIVLLAIPATRNKSFVRFHCLQSLLFAAAAAILGLTVKLFFLIFSLLPIVGFLFSWLLLGIVSIGITVLWVVLIVKAAQGNCYELPIIGPVAMWLTEWKAPLFN
jgi:uncharacterized membrane protein